MSDVAAAEATPEAPTGAEVAATQNLLDTGGTPAPQAAPDAGTPTPAAEPSKPAADGVDVATADKSSETVVTPEDPVDWRHEFAQGFSDDKDRDAFLNEAGRAENKAAFGKRFLDLRRAQSRSIALPSEDDPEREAKMADIFTKLGRPEDPDKYEINWGDDAPELNEAQKAGIEEFKQVHFRNGGTQQQLNELINWNKAQAKAEAEAFRVKAEDITQENTRTLKAVWGDDFEVNAQAYSAAVKHYAGDDYDTFANLQLADGTMARNNPVIARMMARVGRERSNDDFDYTPMNAERKESSQEKLDALYEDLAKKGIRPTHPDYPAAEIDRLAQAASSTRRRSPMDQHRR